MRRNGGAQAGHTPSFVSPTHSELGGKEKSVVEVWRTLTATSSRARGGAGVAMDTAVSQTGKNGA